MSNGAARQGIHAVHARIDARAPSGSASTVTPATKLAGLTLLGRHLRLVSRLGWRGAEILVDGDRERAEVEEILRRERPPAELEVSVSDRPESPPSGTLVVPLVLRAVYTRDALAGAAASQGVPAPLARVEHLSDLQAARTALVRGLRKSVSHDGVVAYLVMRPLSQRLALALSATRVTPNQVTIVALLFGVAGGLCAAAGSYRATALAAVLVWLGAVVDCVDGDLARLRIEVSRLGQWLDTLADDVTTFGLLAGLGVGLYRDGAGLPWLAVGAGAALVWAITEAKVYADLHRLGLPIDTAVYPWFFGDPSQGPAARGGALSRLVWGVGLLFKRDAFITIVAALLLLDHRRLATAALAAGAVILFALLLVHLALGAARRQGRG